MRSHHPDIDIRRIRGSKKQFVKGQGLLNYWQSGRRPDEVSRNGKRAGVRCACLQQNIHRKHRKLPSALKQFLQQPEPEEKV